MSRQAFPKTNFTDSTGAPLANGYVLISLSEDVLTPDGGQTCAGLPVNVQLDSSGNMISVPQIWPNSSLLPSGTTYVYSAYAADGQPSSGPDSLTV